MTEMIIRRTQERVSNRYLGATSQVHVYNKRKKMWEWKSLWNFQVCNKEAVTQEIPPPGSDVITLTAITPTNHYEDRCEDLNLKHWGVK